MRSGTRSRKTAPVIKAPAVETPGRLSAAEYRALVQAPEKKRSKYGSVKTGNYDSTGERNYHQHLLTLEKAGILADVQHHVRIGLVVNGKPLKNERGRLYTWEADFCYRELQSDEPDRIVLDDFKGFDTRESALKRAIVRNMGYKVILTRKPNRQSP